MQELTGGRVHLHHGPIDIVLKAWGRDAEVRTAYRAASARFTTILDECVADLVELRRPMSQAPAPRSSPGHRMTAACAPFAERFITPMAAVAGAVADELMAAMTCEAELLRAFVNNGGDIAVHVTGGETLALGIAGDFASAGVPGTNGRIFIDAGSGIGGVATSGARGRSFSLGIADAVTVLARSAALADAAATMVANAVDIETDTIVRQPAFSLDPDSDLGVIPVTTSVGRLTPEQIDLALARGHQRADDLVDRGIIIGASLMLRGAVVLAGRRTAVHLCAD